MNEATLQAFLNELGGLEKDAFLGQAAKFMGRKIMAAPGALWKGIKAQPGQFRDAGKRMITPHKSIPAGWRHMTPSKELGRLQSNRAALQSVGANTAKIDKSIAQYSKGMGKHITEGAGTAATKNQALRGMGMAGAFKEPGRITRAAEALSRRGWTGKGNVTKYIPGFSQKGLYTGFGAMSGKSIYDAAKRKPTATGEGGVAETGLGEALGTGAFIAGTGGLGILPATAMWLGGSAVGSRAGRIIDRLRGGADPRTAVMAPTPAKAQKMLAGLEQQSPEEQQETIETLRRYYG